MYDVMVEKGLYYVMIYTYIHVQCKMSVTRDAITLTRLKLRTEYSINSGSSHPYL